MSGDIDGLNRVFVLAHAPSPSSRVLIPFNEEALTFS